jgi:hypothetical protein
MEFLNQIIDQLPAWVHAATLVLSAATVVTALTPSNTDNQVVNLLLKLLNAVAGNVGKNRNADDKKGVKMTGSVLMVMLAGCLILSVMSGCAWWDKIGIDQESAAHIEASTARHVGYTVVDKRPDLIRPIILACDVILAGDEINAALERAFAELLEMLDIDDPLLAEDIQTLMSIIHLDTGELETDLEQELLQIRRITAGIRRGVLIYMEQADADD